MDNMKDIHFENIKRFIANFWSYKKEVTLNKTLDDLGMYGDDKRDFLIAFFEKFQIDSGNINYDDFCESETFNPLGVLFGKKSYKKKEISINHLISVISYKGWFDPE